MRSFAAASTIPVTNKVAHANSRKSLRILVMTTPPAHGPLHRDLPVRAADVMGIPPTLRLTLDVSIGSPPNSLFLDDYVPVRFLTPDVGRVINPVLSARLRDAPRCAHSRHMHSS